MPVVVSKKLRSASGGKIESERSLGIGQEYLISRPSGSARLATVLDIRTNSLGLREAYVSYAGQDKRLDSWVKEENVVEQGVLSSPSPTTIRLDGDEADGHRSKRLRIEEEGAKTPSRGRQPMAELQQPEASTSKLPPSVRAKDNSPSAPSTPEREHASMTRVRNFEDVRFGEYLVKTWYFSPYPFPLEENSQAATPATTSTAISNGKKKHILANGHQGEVIDSAASIQKPRASTRTASDMFACGVGKGGEGVRGRLWACDLCFKYMRTRDGWERHTATCDQLQPPGRRVYQKASYTIWEVDGAEARLYCQNLSLFGKLFIDHKSVFFHVENFLFYVLCDAATSRRDQVMAFFSKEKFSYDDYNLACIVTFPPHQNRGFGKLLIEFSYYLTLHPLTRPTSGSPGTPERPLSDLGLKSYTAFWGTVILRTLRRLLSQAKHLPSAVILQTPSPKKISPITNKSVSASATGSGSGLGRTLRSRNELGGVGEIGSPAGGWGAINERSNLVEKEMVNGIEIIKTHLPAHKSQYSISLDLKSLAKACHLRIDDTAFTLSELSLLRYRRPMTSISSTSAVTSAKRRRVMTNTDGSRNPLTGDAGRDDDNDDSENLEHDLGEWKDVQIVITREMVEKMCEVWRVRENPVLDESCVLL